MTTVRIREARAAEVEKVTLDHESVPVLPVFTAEERFEDFFGRARGEGVRISPMATYPFELAQMIARMGANGEIEALVFDPVRASTDGWKSAREPIPVEDFVRFAEVIRPAVVKLVTESKGSFGLAPPGSEAFAKAMRRQLPQINNIVENARTRMSEWNT